MLTALDKAIAGAILAFLATLNSKYGFHFDTGDAAQSFLNGFVDAAINGLVTGVAVWMFPNKGAPK